MKTAAIIVLLALGAAGLALASAAEDKEAVSLFNGKDLTGWRLRHSESKERPGKWSVVGAVRLQDGMPDRFAAESGTGVLVNGGDGRGIDLLTRAEHGDCELHVEFNVPKGSNSGVYFQGQYEVQILDSYGKKDSELTYHDCGGIYDPAKSPPRTNACKPPGQWQTYDINFRAPRFDASGKKTERARFLKVVHNSKVIQENVEVPGPTVASLGGAEKPYGPILLQGDHGPVAFRNIRITGDIRAAGK
jgi:rubredoxin